MTLPSNVDVSEDLEDRFSLNDDALSHKITWVLTNSENGDRSNLTNHYQDERNLIACLLLSRITSSTSLRDMALIRFPSISTFVSRLLRFYLKNHHNQNLVRDLNPLPLLQLALIILTKMYSFDIEGESDNKNQAIRVGDALVWNELSWISHVFLLGEILSSRESIMIDSIDVEIVQTLTILLTYYSLVLPQLQRQPINDSSLKTNGDKLAFISRLPDIILERLIINISPSFDIDKDRVIVSNISDHMQSQEVSTNVATIKIEKVLEQDTETVVPLPETDSDGINTTTLESSWDCMATKLIENISVSSCRGQHDKQGNDDRITNYANITLVFLEMFLMFSSHPNSTGSTSDFEEDFFRSIVMSRNLYIKMIQFTLRLDKIKSPRGTDCYYDKQRFLLLTLSYIQHGLSTDPQTTDKKMSFFSDSSSQLCFNMCQTLSEGQDRQFVDEVSRLLLFGLMFDKVNCRSDVHDMEPNKHANQTETELVNDSARVLSLETLAYMLEVSETIVWLIRPMPNTFEWSSISVASDGSPPLLCIILRLVACELNIAVDDIMDIFMYKYFDSHAIDDSLATVIQNESCTLENICKSIIACIRIGLVVLQQMVTLQDHVDEMQDRDVCRKLTPESIMHIRQSFQSVINTVVVLLSYDIEATFVRWNGLLTSRNTCPKLPQLISDCFFLCCRFMTNYAEETDLLVDENDFSVALIKNVKAFYNITNQHE